MGSAQASHRNARARRRFANGALQVAPFLATHSVGATAGGKCEVKATGDVKVESSGKVEVKSSGATSVEASGAVKVKGSNVGIN